MIFGASIIYIFRATEVLKEYFNKKRSGVCRQLNMSPEKIRTVVFGLAKPFDKRISNIGIINPSFRCINKRMERFVMTNECTVSRARFQTILIYNRRLRVR